MAWKKESVRHSLASRGIKTAQKINPIIKNIINNYVEGWSMKTTVPIADFPESYGYEGKLVWMNPRDFLKKAQTGYFSKETQNWSEEEHRKNTSFKSSMDKVKQGLKAKKGQVPIGYLEVNQDGRLDHEGRNRAWASIDLGIKKIPVKVIWNPKYENKPDWI